MKVRTSDVRYLELSRQKYQYRFRVSQHRYSSNKFHRSFDRSPDRFRNRFLTRETDVPDIEVSRRCRAISIRGSGLIFVLVGDLDNCRPISRINFPPLSAKSVFLFGRTRSASSRKSRRRTVCGVFLLFIYFFFSVKFTVAYSFASL